MSDFVDLTSVMSADDMLALRKNLRLTQADMADRMGLSKSAYVAIETKVATMRKIHQLAAERIALELGGDINWAYLPKNVRDDAARLAATMHQSQEDDGPF